MSMFSTLKLPELPLFVPLTVPTRLFSLCNPVPVVAAVVDDDDDDDDVGTLPWVVALYNWSLSQRLGPRNADEFHGTFEAISPDSKCLSDLTRRREAMSRRKK